LYGEWNVSLGKIGGHYHKLHKYLALIIEK